MNPQPLPHRNIQNVGGKLIISREEGKGGGHPFTENSAKIINLIFEPFPYRERKKLRDALQERKETISCKQSNNSIHRTIYDII